MSSSTETKSNLPTGESRKDQAAVEFLLASAARTRGPASDDRHLNVSLARQQAAYLLMVTGAEKWISTAETLSVACEQVQDFAEKLRRVSDAKQMQLFVDDVAAFHLKLRKLHEARGGQDSDAARAKQNTVAVGTKWTKLSIPCPKCQQMTYYNCAQQTRAGDEMTKQRYECTTCNPNAKPV